MANQATSKLGACFEDYCMRTLLVGDAFNLIQIRHIDCSGGSFLTLVCEEKLLQLIQREEELRIASMYLSNNFRVDEQRAEWHCHAAGRHGQ